MKLILKKNHEMSLVAAQAGTILSFRSKAATLPCHPDASQKHWDIDCPDPIWIRTKIRIQKSKGKMSQRHNVKKKGGWFSWALLATCLLYAGLHKSFIPTVTHTDFEINASAVDSAAAASPPVPVWCCSSEATYPPTSKILHRNVAVNPFHQQMSGGQAKPKENLWYLGR